MSDANSPLDAAELRFLNQFTLQKSLTDSPMLQVEALEKLLSDQGPHADASQISSSLMLGKSLTAHPSSQTQELRRLMHGETAYEKLLREEPEALIKSGLLDAPGWGPPGRQEITPSFWSAEELNPEPALTLVDAIRQMSYASFEKLFTPIEPQPKAPSIIPENLSRAWQDLLALWAPKQPFYGSSAAEVTAQLKTIMTREGNPTAIEEPHPSMKGFGTTMMLGTGIDLADAAIKRDANKAVAVGTGVLGGEAYMAFALGTAGAASLPVALAIGGAVGGGFDTYAAIRNHDTQRAVKSGLETTLYGIAAWAGAAGVAGVWFPPLAVGAETVALVAGGLAVSMTLSRTIGDHWNTVKSWFNGRETASLTPAAPVMASPALGLAKMTAG